MTVDKINMQKLPSITDKITQQKIKYINKNNKQSKEEYTIIFRPVPFVCLGSNKYIF